MGDSSTTSSASRVPLIEMSTSDDFLFGGSKDDDGLTDSSSKKTRSFFGFKDSDDLPILLSFYTSLYCSVSNA